MHVVRRSRADLDRGQLYIRGRSRRPVVRVDEDLVASIQRRVHRAVGVPWSARRRRALGRRADPPGPPPAGDRSRAGLSVVATARATRGRVDVRGCGIPQDRPRPLHAALGVVGFAAQPPAGQLRSRWPAAARARRLDHRRSVAVSHRRVLEPRVAVAAARRVLRHTPALAARGVWRVLRNRDDRARPRRRPVEPAMAAATRRVRRLGSVDRLAAAGASRASGGADRLETAAQRPDLRDRVRGL